MLRARARSRSSRPVSLLVAVGLALLVVGLPTPASAATYRAPYSKMEHYALHLLNCLRTGGYVTSSGRCRGDRSNGRRALTYSVGIAGRVARPYARRLARCGCLSHYLTRGGYDTRFAAAGYHRYNGESIAMGGWGTVRRDVISGIRIFQCEKSGYACGTGTRWHWYNLVNTRFRQVGIGIARRNGRSYVVYDFYR
jgi:hypothetical protein